jgi:hypothetical protein
VEPSKEVDANVSEQVAEKGVTGVHSAMVVLYHNMTGEISMAHCVRPRLVAFSASFKQ